MGSRATSGGLPATGSRGGRSSGTVGDRGPPPHRVRCTTPRDTTEPMTQSTGRLSPKRHLAASETGPSCRQHERSRSRSQHPAPRLDALVVGDRPHTKPAREMGSLSPTPPLHGRGLRGHRGGGEQPVEGRGPRHLRRRRQRHHPLSTTEGSCTPSRHRGELTSTIRGINHHGREEIRGREDNTRARAPKER